MALYSGWAVPPDWKALTILKRSFDIVGSAAYDITALRVQPCLLLAPIVLLFVAARGLPGRSP